MPNSASFSIIHRCLMSRSGPSSFMSTYQARKIMHRICLKSNIASSLFCFSETYHRLMCCQVTLKVPSSMATREITKCVLHTMWCTRNCLSVWSSLLFFFPFQFLRVKVLFSSSYMKVYLFLKFFDWILVSCFRIWGPSDMDWSKSWTLCPFLTLSDWVKEPVLIFWLDLGWIILSEAWDWSWSIAHRPSPASWSIFVIRWTWNNLS